MTKEQVLKVLNGSKRSGLTGTAAGPREEQKERNGRGGGGGGGAGGGQFSEFNVPSTTLGHLRERERERI